MSRVEIEIRNLRKSFGELEVLKGVDFEVREHEVVALIGPSGSGKSTLLRCLNFLEIPNEGDIVWEREEVDYRNMNPRELTAHRTHMGMVFQHFNLFPHRNALENVIEGPMFVAGVPRQQAREEGVILLEQVGLGDKWDAWPSQLSGGQQQRVAIARALAMKPKMLLLDEVTSALDVEMISGINDLLKGLAQQGMTMVVVTHDLGFAREVADRICFLEEGHILESGQTDQLLESPSNSRLTSFLESCLSANVAQN